MSEKSSKTSKPHNRRTEVSDQRSGNSGKNCKPPSAQFAEIAADLKE